MNRIKKKMNFRGDFLASPDRTKFETDLNEDKKTADIIVQNDIQTEDSKSNHDEFDRTGIDNFKEFENWLIANGAEFPDLYLKEYSEDVRGVHARKEIDSYVCILSIPLKCLITDFMGRTQTSIGRKIFSSKCSLSSPNLIAVIIYILTTREDPQHFFQPYYRILPKSYSNFPIFWDSDKLAWLKGSPLIEDIMERKNNMRADYNEVCRVCQEFERYSFEEFLEIRTAVGSRNFGIVVNGEKRTAMVPYADMLNHYRPRETSWTFENSKNAFTITSISHLKAEQQVMDSYGKKCNSKFFLHYGFAVECNREEDGKCQNELHLKFSLGSSVDDPLRDTRLALLGTSRATRISMNIEDKATAEALSFLRVKVANEAELNQMIARQSVHGMQRQTKHIRTGRDSFIGCLNPHNEAAALEKLAQYCSRQLQRYPNSFEENLALLQSRAIAPFSDRRTALIVIIGEQEICRFWIYAANQLCPLLRSKDREVLKESLRNLPRKTFAERDLARYSFSILGSRSL